MKFEESEIRLIKVVGNDTEFERLSKIFHPDYNNYGRDAGVDVYEKIVKIAAYGINTTKITNMEILNAYYLLVEYRLI